MSLIYPLNSIITPDLVRGEYSTLNQALLKKSGAQTITTDYYLPSTLFPSTYQAIFKEGKYLRKNKLNGINNLNEEHKK